MKKIDIFHATMVCQWAYTYSYTHAYIHIQNSVPKVCEMLRKGSIYLHKKFDIDFIHAPYIPGSKMT